MIRNLPLLSQLFRAVICFSVLFIADTLAGHAQVVFNSEFGTASQPVLTFANSPNPNVTGVLPTGWHDNSEWNESKAHLSVVEDAGETLLQIDIAQVKGGNLQLAFKDLPGFPAGTSFRVTARIRNATSGVVDLMMRQRGAPYTVYWTERIAPTSTWRDIDGTFTLDETTTPAAFLISANSQGLLEVDRVQLEQVAGQSDRATQSGGVSGTLIETDFGSADQPILDRSRKPNPKAEGMLPKGWFDDASWANVWYSAKAMAEDDKSFLRLEVNRRESGQLQISNLDMPKVEVAGKYRMTLIARSLTGSPVQIGIRQRGEPYRMLWDNKLSLTPEWRSFELESVLEPEASDVGIWLLLQQGQVDLDLLKLEKVGEDEVVSNIDAKFPDGGPANVLPWSRLPLGLASGWTVKREVSLGTEFIVEGDTSINGEANAPVLKIDATEAGELTSAPFKLADPRNEHVFRFRAQGEGTWASNIRMGEKDIKGNRTLDLKSGEWTTFEIPFKPQGLDSIYFLRWEGQGKLWIDQIQVGPAEKVRDGFTAAGEAEIALTMKKGDASHVRVHFEDEVPALRYLATGDLTGAELRAVAVNVYGERLDLPIIDVSQTPEGEFNYAVFAGRKMGPHRVEAHIERNGEKISPMTEWVAYHLPRPKYWGKDAPDSPFGVHMNSALQQIDAAKAVGVNWTRLHDAGIEYIGWYNLEPERGKWQFFDEDIKRFRDRGIMIYGQLGTAPGWASHFKDSGKDRFQYWDKYFQITEWDAYQNYVRTVVDRYKADIPVYCVWNEPWIHAWFGKSYDSSRGNVRQSYVPSDNPQKDFVELKRLTWDAAKGTWPQVAITGYNTTSKDSGNVKFAISGEDWTRGVHEAGGLRYSDVVDYHMYSSELNGFPGDYVERGLEKALGPIRKDVGDLPLPVWMSEGNGAFTLMGPGFYNHTLPWDVHDSPFVAGNAQLRYTLSQLANGVEKVFLYSMGSQGLTLPDMGNSFAIHTGYDGWMHPAGAAHATFARLLEDKRFIERTEISPKVHAYLFSDGTETVAVLSTEPGFQPSPVPQPTGARVLDLFNNPVKDGENLGINLVYVIAPGDAKDLVAKLSTN